MKEVWRDWNELFIEIQLSSNVPVDSSWCISMPGWVSAFEVTDLAGSDARICWSIEANGTKSELLKIFNAPVNVTQNYGLSDTILY